MTAINGDLLAASLVLGTYGSIRTIYGYDSLSARKKTYSEIKSDDTLLSKIGSYRQMVFGTTSFSQRLVPAAMVGASWLLAAISVRQLLPEGLKDPLTSIVKYPLSDTEKQLSCAEENTINTLKKDNSACEKMLVYNRVYDFVACLGFERSTDGQKAAQSYIKNNMKEIHPDKKSADPRFELLAELNQATAPRRTKDYSDLPGQCIDLISKQRNGAFGTIEKYRGDLLNPVAIFEFQAECKKSPLDNAQLFVTPPGPHRTVFCVKDNFVERQLSCAEKNSLSRSYTNITANTACEELGATCGKIDGFVECMGFKSNVEGFQKAQQYVAERFPVSPSDALTELQHTLSRPNLLNERKALHNACNKLMLPTAKKESSKEAKELFGKFAEVKFHNGTLFDMDSISAFAKECINLPFDQGEPVIVTPDEEDLASYLACRIKNGTFVQELSSKTGYLFS